MNDELIAYVTNAKAKGIRVEHVRDTLKHAGWNESVIEEVIRKYYKPVYRVSFLEALHSTFRVLSSRYRWSLFLLSPLIFLLIKLKILPTNSLEQIGSIWLVQKKGAGERN